MVFSYDEHSGAELLYLDGDLFRHIFLSRRAKLGDRFLFRNLKDPFVYEYEAESIDKKGAKLLLVSKTKDESDEKKERVSIAWCVVDPKIVEKTIPFLNELGVDDLYFIYSSRSQKNFKIDLERIERIAINSCSQCGRNLLMNIVIFESLERFCDDINDFCVLDFGGEAIQKEDKKIWLIGPEGGFSEREQEFLKHKNIKKISFKTKNILRSETAAVAAASLLAEL